MLVIKWLFVMVGMLRSCSCLDTRDLMQLLLKCILSNQRARFVPVMVNMVTAMVMVMVIMVTMIVMVHIWLQ